MSEKKQTAQQVQEKLLENRIIFINGAVDSKLAGKIIPEILFLDSVDSKKEIKVLINSPGGEITSGYAIFDLLRAVKSPVTTLVAGLAASMGSVLSLAADKSRCFMLDNAQIMIHQPLLQGAQGSVTDIEIHASQILKSRERIAKLYAEKTGKAVDVILTDIDKDYWLNSTEAKEYGLVDKIITDYASW